MKWVYVQNLFRMWHKELATHRILLVLRGEIMMQSNEKVRCVIEQIEVGHEDIKLFGRTIFKKTPDILCLSKNGECLGLLQFLNLHYKQIGTFEINRPHLFEEWQDVDATLKDGKVVMVEIV